MSICGHADHRKSGGRSRVVSEEMAKLKVVSPSHGSRCEPVRGRV